MEASKGKPSLEVLDHVAKRGFIRFERRTA